MNIALYVAARNGIRAGDLKPTAKAAVLAVISHCPQGREVAPVSIETMAGDLAVHWTTAQRALDEARKAGFLVVEKRARNSQATVWKVATSQFATSQSARADPSQIANRARANCEGPGEKKEKRRGGAARSPSRASAAPVEKRGASNRLNGEPTRLANIFAVMPEARDALRRGATDGTAT